MLLQRFLQRVPVGGGVPGLPSDFPTTLDHLELYLDSREFADVDTFPQGTGIGDPTAWTDQSGQTQGAARDGVQTTVARQPAVQQPGSGFESPLGAPSVKFVSQTGTPIGPNPFNQLASSAPAGVGNPWDEVSRGHTFIWVGRVYNMGTGAVLWQDLLSNRAQFTSRGGLNVIEAEPHIRTQSGTYYILNTPGSIFTANPLPWGLLVLRLRPPINTAGGIDLRRWERDNGWIDYVPEANAQWSTAGTSGWVLSGAGSNVPQNMDLGACLWYSTALTDAQLELLRAWNTIYFGEE